MTEGVAFFPSQPDDLARWVSEWIGGRGKKEMEGAEKGKYDGKGGG